MMLMYTGTGSTLGEIEPKPDAPGRQLMDVEELLSRYYSDRKLLRELIDAPRRRIATDAR